MTANNIWQWFQENEASTGGVTDKIQNYLTAAGYTGATNEALYRWLGARGYEGSLADRIYQFEYFNTFRYIDISAKLVLEKFGTDAHVWIPGIGYFNGLQAGNYIDSAGTQAGLVDNPVGLVMDAEGSLGAELVTSSTASFDNAALNASIQVGVTSGADDKIFAVTYTLNITSGSVRLVVYGATKNYPSGNIRSVSGTYTELASVNTVGGSFPNTIRVQAQSNGTTATFTNISVKEVVGAVTATQGTTANKPILRRGAVNLLTYSTFIGASGSKPTGWVQTGASNLSALILADQTSPPILGSQIVGFRRIASTGLEGMQPSSAFVPLVNVAYTYSFYVRVPTGITAPNLQIFASGGAPAASIVVASAATLNAQPKDVWVRYSITNTFTTAPTNVAIVMAADTIGTGFDIASPQFELGSTASEYIPTTTAAASSSSGDYCWQFDGSNDSLALSSVPFQMADDHCVVAGARLIASGASRFLFSPAAQPATSQAIAAINADTNGNWAVAWRDDAANVGTVFAAAGALPVGSIGVISGIKTGNNKKLRINGAQSGSTNTTVMGATTVSVGYIGADRNSGQNFLGSIYPVIAIKGTVSDADLLVLERWVGSLSGVSI